MSFLSKLMDTMRLNDGDEDDDYFLDSDYEDEDKPARKSLFKRPAADDLGDDYEEEPAKPRFLSRPVSNNNKVVSMRRGMEVSLIKPTSLETQRKSVTIFLLEKLLF